MDTSVNAANQVVSVGADIAFDADPKFFACLVRFESSSVPTTLPTAYDVYPVDGRHDGGYYTVKDCVTIDVLPRTPGNHVYVGLMVCSNFTATKFRELLSLNQVINEIISLQPLKCCDLCLVLLMAVLFLALMRPFLVLFLVLWLKQVKDFLKVRCRLAFLPFLISCLVWLDLVASLPLIKERILVIILLLHFMSLMLGSVLVLMLPLLVWLTPDLRIKKSLLKCNWTIRKRLPRCKMRLKKRLLAFSRRLHARIRKTRYMHKMRCLLINRRSLLLALRLLWKTPIFPSNSRFPRLCAKCLLKLKRLVSILPMTKSKK